MPVAPARKSHPPCLADTASVRGNYHVSKWTSVAWKDGYDVLDKLYDDNDLNCDTSPVLFGSTAAANEVITAVANLIRQQITSIHIKCPADINYKI